jgi:hypothetical protein
LQSDSAWDWDSSAPWSKQTVTQRYRLSYNYTSSSGALVYSETFSLYTLDDDTVIQPVNVRISASCAPYDNAPYKARVSIAQSGYYYNNVYDSGSFTSPIINYPVQWDTDVDRFDVDMYIFSSESISSCEVSITYDIYYRDPAIGVGVPTEEPFTLPPDWTQNTTAATSPQIELPTVTTVATPSDASEHIDQWLTIPTKITDCANFFGAIIINIFELKYVTFIVLFGIICALLIWFLH